MLIELDGRERDLLVKELENATIPDIRGEIASGMRKALREEFKQDEMAFKGILEKLKRAA